MPSDPLADPIREDVSDSLEYSLSRLREALRAGVNSDVVIRRFYVSGFSAALLFLDGMADTRQLNLHILQPALQCPPYEGDPAGRVDWLRARVLTSASVTQVQELDRVVEAVLRGDAALLADGCPAALTVEAKGFPMRGVEQPVNEVVVIGPHEGFVESAKVNLSLLRRILQSPRFVAERFEAGAGVKSTGWLVYLDGVASEQVLGEARRRLAGINADSVLSLGELEQYIEDSPYALIPQFAHTERPDRAVSFLMSGMFLLFLDGSPMVLAAPATVLHMVHTSDMTHMRFPYGTFLRLVLVVGMLLATFMPALYLALVTHHNETLPLALMTSIYETQSHVQVPVFFELLFMTVSFDLISQAGARMPGALSHGLGVVSALILGQAAVAADLVSPMLIIVVAVSSLGLLTTPDYFFSIGLRLTQFVLLVSAALGGLFGMMLVTLLFATALCSMTSMGAPMLWPYAPARMHNPDLVTRYPLWQQRVRNYLSHPARVLRMRGRGRAWEKDGKEDGHGQ